MHQPTGKTDYSLTVDIIAPIHTSYRPAGTEIGFSIEKTIYFN